MKTKLFLILAFLFAFNFANSQQRKLALVIGNASYQHGGSLKNPVNDANLMAQTLTDLGFEVTKLTNADLKSMQQASISFTNKIKNYDVALFYYAGHGVQVNGTNYLVPVDAKMETELSTKYEAFDISDINYAFAQNNGKMNIMILDACRDNPFRSWERGGNRGFKAVSNQAAGTIIAFATREGETASDGTGNNGLYTQELVTQMKVAQDINSVFKKTRTAVLQKTNNKQCPQEWDMTTGSFYFKKGSNNNNNNNNNQVDIDEEDIAPLVTYGTLQINNYLQGSLYIDGKYEQIANQNKRITINDLPTGTHTIKIVTDNETWQENVTIRQNQTATLTATSNLPDPQDNKDIPQDMALIKAGSFTMGSPSSEVDRGNDETQHHVSITYDFLMGKHEVTQREYENLMGENPSSFSGCSSCPVENVSWWDAIKYCNALSRKEGFPVAYNESTGDLLDAGGRVTTDITKVQGYRLPTEAEWEYACRAETNGNSSQPFNTGSNLTTSHANYDGNYPYNGNSKGTYREKTIAVGSFSANSWGLYDMHGNVLEWCHDWYGDYHGNVTNPIGVSSGSYRVLRGGSWFTYAKFSRSANRSIGAPTYRFNSFGFRLVRSL